MLATERYADAVRADEAEAGALGISGVPFFVVDRKYGVSGAQPAEALAPGARAGLGRELPADHGRRRRRGRDGLRPRRLPV